MRSGNPFYMLPPRPERQPRVRHRRDRRHRKPSVPRTLTPLLRSTLMDMARGLTHKAVAVRDGVTPGALRGRMDRVHRVLGARNAPNAVYLAMKQGLIE